MEVEGYKKGREKKKDILYSRMDQSMIDQIMEIRTKTGISTSEIIREGVRRLLKDVAAKGSFNIEI
jgi:Arc/MetJ-type ribon-helix-helix transcriptional regulator